MIVALGGMQQVAAIDSSVSTAVNPIRRVVTMLGDMLKKVEKEGDAEEELFNKFMCYCKNGRGSLEKAIGDSEAKAPQTEAAIKGTGAEIEQLAADLEQAKKDRSEADKAVAEATNLRNKEGKEYAKVSGDFKTNVAAMGKAITALEKGATGFLQSSAVPLLKKISINMDLNPGDRDALSAFLSVGENQGYSPAGGEITGILKTMKDTMESDLADATATEEESLKSFDIMSAAKAKEIQALTEEIESKTVRHGEAKVELVTLKADLSDTQAALLDDKAFLEELDKSCATKEGEWAERQKVRAEEMLAIHETIKILNDDDSLELFKKTLPGASLLQMQSTAKAVRGKVLHMLEEHHR